jgi:hypothetical protein
MAQLTINVGTVANDKTGDPLRTAFEKINANFTEAYTNGSIAGTLITAGNNITTSVTDANISVTANGLGIIVLATDTVRISTTRTPSDLTNGASGDTAGDIAWDQGFIYVCVNTFGVATPVWKKATLA